MTTHKGMREDLEMVHHTLTNPRRRAEESKEHDQGAEAEKELHVKKLHDGSYHHTVSHPYGERREGSTHDLDDIHDLLEEHFGEPNADEQEGEHEART